MSATSFDRKAIPSELSGKESIYLLEAYRTVLRVQRDCELIRQHCQRQREMIARQRKMLAEMNARQSALTDRLTQQEDAAFTPATEAEHAA